MLTLIIARLDVSGALPAALTCVEVSLTTHRTTRIPPSTSHTRMCSDWSVLNVYVWLTAYTSLRTKGLAIYINFNK